MAARNPTSFTAYIDESKFRPRKGIQSQELDRVFNDQEFALDMAQMIISDCFWPIKETGTVFVDKRIYHLDSKDMCNEAGVTNNEIQHSVGVYAFTDGVVAGEARLTSTLATASTSVTISITASATPTWYGLGTMNIKTNANEDTLTLALRATSGSGAVYVCGLYVIADET